MGLFKNKELGKQRKCIKCGKLFYDVKFSGETLQAQQALIRQFSKGFTPAVLYHCVKCGKCICSKCLAPNMECKCGNSRFQCMPAVEKK